MQRKNESVQMGFYDSKGKFHPIRSSDDYDPEAVGESSQYARRKKRKRKNPTAVRLKNFSGRIVQRKNGTIQIMGRAKR